MAKTLQFKRGDQTAADAFTGANGELYINTTDFSLRIHDGSTQGGHAVSGSGGVTSYNNLTDKPDIISPFMLMGA